MAKRSKETPPRLHRPRSAGPADKEIGQKIRIRRVEIGMSQERLAQHLGVSFQQIQKYEKGENRIGINRIDMLAAALHVPITFFFKRPNDQERQTNDLIYKDAVFNLRLLRAYEAIGANGGQGLQHDFVSLMEKVAGVMR